MCFCTRIWKISSAATASWVDRTLMSYHCNFRLATSSTNVISSNMIHNQLKQCSWPCSYHSRSFEPVLLTERIWLSSINDHSAIISKVSNYISFTDQHQPSFAMIFAINHMICHHQPSLSNQLTIIIHRHQPPSFIIIHHHQVDSIHYTDNQLKGDNDNHTFR